MTDPGASHRLSGNPVAGPPVPGRGHCHKPVLCSLNEIRALAMKAARAAGLPWGVADEAGRAVGWLEARGLAGLAALDGALERLSAPDWRQRFPVPAGAAWQAPSGEIDGLLAGMTLADRAGQAFPSAGALVLARVRWPLLAVPFLAGVSQDCGARLTVSLGPQAPAVGIGPHSVSESGRALAGVALAESVRIEKTAGSAMLSDLQRLDGGIPVDREAYLSLDRWAARTYVPETTESRARGAGPAAGLI